MLRAKQFRSRVALSRVRRRSLERIIARAASRSRVSKRPTVCFVLDLRQHFLISFHVAGGSSVGKDDPARRSIKEWLEGDEPGDSESIPRRRQLLDAMKDQMDKAAATAPALHEWAIALAMSPMSMRIVSLRGRADRRHLSGPSLVWTSCSRSRCCGRAFLSCARRQGLCPGNCAGQ